MRNKQNMMTKRPANLTLISRKFAKVVSLMS
jgi:hypothetical protein